MASTIIPRTYYPFETTGCPTNYYYPNYEISQKYSSIFNRESTICPPPTVQPYFRYQPCPVPTQQSPLELPVQPSWWTRSNNWCSWNREPQCNFCNTGFRPSNPTEFYCLTNPVRYLDREGNRCIWLCFDMRGYRPEEINVTLNRTERCITVESTHETKEGKEHHVQRRYYRKYCLPESLGKCDLSKCGEIKCHLSSEGQLTVECPLPRMTPEEMTKCPTPCQPGQTVYPCPSCPANWCCTPVNTKCN